MRRFLTLICLLCLAIPAGISISGCTRDPGANYCNGLGYGMKIGDVSVVTIQPATTGISMSYGQTNQVGTPMTLNCKGTQVSSGTFYYGTTNNQLADVSPAGQICAGTWNRNSGGGIANYSICSPPNPLPSTGGLPYAIAYVTASAQGVVSNPVKVYVHAKVTSVSLVTLPMSGSGQQCFSQGAQATLDAQACFASNNTQYELCAPPSVTSNYACPGGLPPGVTSVPDCTAAIGTLSYNVSSSNIASIVTNTTTNQVTLTAMQPGTTPITASVAGSGSSAGYFSTCPPASISVTLANGGTVGTITKGVTQNLTTTVTDTQGHTITGLTLDYESTDPIDISVASTSGGSITTSFPGVASIYATCQPSTCNYSPINEIGLYGTGLSLSSNKVTITTPGTASEYAWFGAPGQSQYIGSVELLTGTVGSLTRLPYLPNSMMMDRRSENIYFGSARELMTFSAISNALTNQTTSVPGVVLAVSPDGQTLLINDQQRQIFYIYTPSAGNATTFGGLGDYAAWTPDSRTLYVTDSASLGGGHTDTLYVYNQNTGWTTHSLPCSVFNATSCPSPSTGAQSLAITIPGVGAYLGGSTTVAHTWCPTGTVGNYNSMIFYPQSDSVAEQNDVLAATTDGQHILGAALTGSGVTLNDIGVTIPTTECVVTTTGVAPNQVQQLLTPLSTSPTLIASLPIPVAKVNATTLNQVVPAPASNLAFITYTGSTASAQLPYYLLGTGGAAGTIGYVPLTTQPGGTAPSAPLAGAFSPDNKLFFVSTAGDNMIHYITIPSVVSPATPPTDSQQISPNLPACTPLSAGGLDPGCNYSGSGTIVPATVIAVKPRATT